MLLWSKASKSVRYILILLLFCFPSWLVWYLFNSKYPPFQSEIRAIDASTWLQMQKHTWHRGCPIDYRDLVSVELTYYGYDAKGHHGKLIINQALAGDVVAIFKMLYQQHFPLTQMQPMEVFKGNDEAAMLANNTSAFNCRAVIGQKNIFSQHSYGRAIDINTLINPYVKGELVLPAKGQQFVDRLIPAAGKITQDSLIVQAFLQRGWDWGGNWYDVQDYHHFEKRANGEKRDPHGYKP